MLVIGLDVETTGLDTDKDVIIELGAVLFSVVGGVWSPVEQYNSKVYEHGYPELSEEIKEITGITSLADGIPFAVALADAGQLMCRAAMAVSHNAVFDRSMILSMIRRFHIEDPGFEHLPWLCSIDDLPKVKTRKCKRLGHLALDFGIPVDPRTLHRADADVLLMGQLLTKLEVDPKAMNAYREQPELVVEIDTPAPWTDGGKGAACAKLNNFRWERIEVRGVEEIHKKTWVKKIKESEFEELKTNCQPYMVALIRRIV